MCKFDGYFSVNGTDITFYSNFDGKPTREWVMHEAGIVGHQCKLLCVCFFFEYCLICVHGKEKNIVKPIGRIFSFILMLNKNFA